MAKNPYVRPDPKFEAAWNLGHDTHTAAVELHEMGSDQPEYGALRDRLEWLSAQPDKMDKDDLIAYIGGLQFSMREHLW